MEKFGYYKDEVDYSLKYLIAKRDVLRFSGEGAQHAAVFLVCKTFEKEYQEKHPKARLLKTGEGEPFDPAKEMVNKGSAED